MREMLQRCLVSGKRLEMIYLSDKGEFSQRMIKLISLDEKTVTAFCYFRRSKRIFKLENILSLAPYQYKCRSA